MKSLKSALLALIVAAGIANVANAQTMPATAKTQKPFAVKLGVLFPSQGTAKDIAGSTVFNFGLGYDLGKTKSESPIVYGAYVDGAFGKNNNHNGSVDVKGEGSFIGVGPQARYYFGAPTSNFHFYGGAGIGLYFLHAKGSGEVNGNGSGNGDSFTQTESRNRTTIGGKIFGGVEFSQGFLAELTFHLPGEVEGIRLNGFAVALGYRF